MAQLHPLSEVELGFPLSRDEYGAMRVRLDFQNDIHDVIVPFLNSQPEVLGFYIDADGDGQLVVLVSKPLPLGAIGEIERNLPPGPGMSVLHAEFSDSLMRERVRELSGLWLVELPAHSFTSISSNLETQRIELSVPPASVEAARTFIERQSRGGEPPIVLRIESQDEATMCTSRDYCFSPQKAGNVIRRGGTLSDARCTMGFHIRSGSARQFVTSAHCDWKTSDDPWTLINPKKAWAHQGYGILGERTATMYPSLNIDIMRVNITNTQASNQIYSNSEAVGSSRHPVLGELVCASRGVSNDVHCGNVTSTWQSYTPARAPYIMYGANVAYTTVKGDSGSPVFAASLSGGKRVALGVNSTTAGRFGRLQDALNHWGWTVVI